MSGETARDEAVDAGREGRRIVGHLAVEDLRLVEQQLGQVRHVGVARAELGVGHRLDERMARVDLEDRLGAGAARSGAPAAARARGRAPTPCATRQAALSVSRCEARTSDTRSPSAALTAATITASSTAPRLRLGSSLGLSSSSGTRPKSTSPWLSDLSGLPSKPSGIEVQKASTGSVSSSTSMPRARAASSFGFDFRRSGAVADQVVDLGLVGLAGRPRTA